MNKIHLKLGGFRTGPIWRNGRSENSIGGVRVSVSPGSKIARNSLADFWGLFEVELASVFLSIGD